MTQPGLRALVGSRVSVKRNNRRHKSSGKVSHLAQREIGYRKATELGATVIGTFEDLDVSATVSPFDRADLKHWLDMEQQGHGWDLIVWASLDRGFRDPRDAIQLADWCEKNKKIVILAEQGITLDYRPNADPMARMLAEMFLLIGSMFAKWELTNHRNRALNAHSVLREMDRWAGGPAPEGFRIVPHPDGKGKTLNTDPDRKAMVWLAASRLLGADVDLINWKIGPTDDFLKDSFNGIAAWLTSEGYMTNVDRHRDPEDRKGTEWWVSDVIKFLTSPATQGIKLSGEKPVLREDGLPLQIAPPTFDNHTWTRIQHAAQERQLDTPRIFHGENPLLGVSKCGQCESNMAHIVAVRETKKHPEGIKHRYYRCGRRPKPCPKIGMRADEVETILEHEFLRECGNLPVLERTFVPGEDHTEELEKVHASIKRLQRESDMGLISSTEEEESYFKRMASLSAKKKELQALPQRSAGWEYRETGKTYGEAWKEAEDDTLRRRKMLIDAGVRFIIHGPSHGEVEIPDNIIERMRK